MTASPTPDSFPAGSQSRTIFTIVGGPTVPDRAAIVREHCREGSTVELRRVEDDADCQTGIGVWLACRTLLGLVSVWKRIGHVPVETAQALEPLMDKTSTLVARGTVRRVYAPIGRDEAVVTVEIAP